MPDKITEQQAVKIAEWVGAEVKGVNGKFIRVGEEMITVQEWLSSPEGEVAMMNRVDKDRWIQKHSSYTYTIGLQAEVYGTSRNHALQLSILEMLGRKGE